MNKIKEILCPLCYSSQHVVEKTRNSFSLLHCKDCGLVFSDSINSDKDLYENAYQHYGDYSKYIENIKNDKFHLTWANKKFFSYKNLKGTLLDVGCSTGGFLLTAKGKGWKVKGIEISPSAAKIAYELTKSEIIVGDIDSLDINQNFDTITAWEVIEHLKEPGNFIKKCYQLLNKDGIFAISVPNWESKWMKKSNQDEHWPPFHLTFWNKNTLKNYLISVGFKDVIVKVKPFAWKEELGSKAFFVLPYSLLQSLVFNNKDIHIFAYGRK